MSVKAGRKRRFNKGLALDKAMRVFWENGYSGTSLSDLTEALKINKPSLYAAFGNKELLFKACLEHYLVTYGLPIREDLFASDDLPVRTRLQDYLYGFIKLFSGTTTPKGCFFVRSRCESGSTNFPEQIALYIKESDKERLKALSAFLKMHIQNGDLKEDTDTKSFANYLISLLFGLAVQARMGQSKKSLKNIVDTAINAHFETNLQQ